MSKTNLTFVIPAKRSAEPGPVSRNVRVFIQRPRLADPGSASGMTMVGVGEKGVAR